MSITWKRDKGKECDDRERNSHTNGKNNKELNAAATSPIHIFVRIAIVLNMFVSSNPLHIIP